MICCALKPGLRFYSTRKHAAAATVATVALATLAVAVASVWTLAIAAVLEMAAVVITKLSTITSRSEYRNWYWRVSIASWAVFSFNRRNSGVVALSIFFLPRLLVEAILVTIKMFLLIFRFPTLCRRSCRSIDSFRPSRRALSWFFRPGIAPQACGTGHVFCQYRHLYFGNRFSLFVTRRLWSLVLAALETKALVLLSFSCPLRRLLLVRADNDR